MDIPLDHNFPEPILNSLRDFITEVNLIPLRRIDERLPELDDRRLVIAIHQLGFPGFVTSNYKMLQNPRELAAVIATVVTDRTAMLTGAAAMPRSVSGVTTVPSEIPIARQNTRASQLGIPNGGPTSEATATAAIDPDTKPAGNRSMCRDPMRRNANLEPIANDFAR